METNVSRSLRGMLAALADARDLAPEYEARLRRILDDLEFEARHSLNEAELVEPRDDNREHFLVRRPREGGRRRTRR